MFCAVASCRRRKARGEGRGLGWPSSQMTVYLPSPGTTRSQLDHSHLSFWICVFLSVLPQTWHACCTDLGFWFFPSKQQMEITAILPCFRIPPAEAHINLLSPRALVHIWMSFHSKLLAWSINIFQFNEGPRSLLS